MNCNTDCQNGNPERHGSDADSANVSPLPTSGLEGGPERNPHDPATGFCDRSDQDINSLMKPAEVSEFVKKSPSQVRRLYRAGKFPEPIHIGRTPMWPREQIQAWLKAKAQKGGAA